MPTINEVMAKVNREVAGGLARAVRAMPEDKFAWSPLGEGRTAHDQVCESIDINFWVAHMLRDRAMPPIDPSQLDLLKQANQTIDLATQQLLVSADTLAGAIESFPSQRLSDTIKLPWDDSPSTFAEVMLLGYWNMTYHLGQISYIQSLYGDREMH